MIIHRILCPIDFSDASTHAIEQAITVGGWYGARITALHVTNPALSSAPAGAGPGGMNESEADRLRETIASRYQPAMAEGMGLDIVIEAGDPAAVILERAAGLASDLVVMGTHGVSGFQHLMLGSVTEKVLRKASCPVMTVPPRGHGTARLPFQRVLCALDFSASSQAALEYAVSLARESRSALTLLHVLEWPWPEPPAPTFADLAPAQAAALAEYRRYSEERAQARLRSLVPPEESASTATRIRHGKAYVEVLALADEEGSDVIVLGVAARNALELAVFGSTANQLVRRATCPVLTVRRGPA